VSGGLHATREALDAMEGSIEFLADARTWAAALAEVAAAEEALLVLKVIVDGRWLPQGSPIAENADAALRALGATGETA
jgi:hypothetical protein